MGFYRDIGRSEPAGRVGAAQLPPVSTPLHERGTLVGLTGTLSGYLMAADLSVCCNPLNWAVTDIQTLQIVDMCNLMSLEISIYLWSLPHNLCQACVGGD